MNREIIQTATLINELTPLCHAYGNLARVLAAQGKWNEGLEYAQQGLSICRQHSNYELLNYLALDVLSIAMRAHGPSEIGTAVTTLREVGALFNPRQRRQLHELNAVATLSAGDRRTALEHLLKAYTVALDERSQVYITERRSHFARESEHITDLIIELVADELESKAADGLSFMFDLTKCRGIYESQAELWRRREFSSEELRIIATYSIEGVRCILDAKEIPAPSWQIVGDSALAVPCTWNEAEAILLAKLASV